MCAPFLRFPVLQNPNIFNIFKVLFMGQGKERSERDPS